MGGAGTVVFRAADADGGHGLYVWRQGQGVELLTSPGEFGFLGNFPCVTPEGAIGCAALIPGGRPSFFVWHEGVAEPVQVAGPEIDTVRGGLLTAPGASIVFATPRQGLLGVYSCLERQESRVFGIGDEFESGIISDFALNPVSVNGTGSFVSRMKLEDGRQFVVTATPILVD